MKTNLKNLKHQSTLLIAIMIMLTVALFSCNEDDNEPRVPDNSTVTDDIPEDSTIINYYWEFTNAEPSTSTEANPKVKFLTEGIQTITLRVDTVSVGKKSTNSNSRVKFSGAEIIYKVLIKGAEIGVVKLVDDLVSDALRDVDLIVFEAMEGLENQSVNWHLLLEQLAEDTKALDEDIAASINEITNDAVQNVEAGLMCSTDFLLNALKAQLNNLLRPDLQYTLNGAVCLSNPKSLEMHLSQVDRDQIKLVGYLLKNNLQVFVEYLNGEKEAIDQYLAFPGLYNAVLNLGQTGFYITEKNIKQFVFILNNEDKYEVPVIYPECWPKACPRKARLDINFEYLVNLESSKECEAEVYMNIYVNGKEKLNIWKNITDRDRSSIPDCNQPVSIGIRNFVIEEIEENRPVTIKIDFYEKDGKYRRTAYFSEKMDNWLQWGVQDINRFTRYSTRTSGDFGDMDFKIKIKITREWL